MKIEILSIQNLNSLSGKSELNFNREPFNGSGLFAITGPTGAGKSTIFDAICLALYGRTPRLKNPDEIMSRHSSECYTELTFSVNNKRYRSCWEQRRSRGKAEGKLQSAKMFVIDLNDNEESIIEEKKSAVPPLIAKITGLDYDQFTRSILLAQGNFASFLRAGINERADLLEKMTGSEIYSRLSIEAFNRSKTEDEKLERHKEKLGDTELLNIDQLNEYRNEKNGKLQRREEIKKEIVTLTENQKWLEQEVILKYKLDSAEYDLRESQAKEKEAESLIGELSRINKIIEYLPVFESYHLLKDNLEKKNNEQKLFEAEISNIKNQVSEQTDIVESDKTSLEHSHGEIAEIQEKINSARISEERIQNTNIQLEETRNLLRINKIDSDNNQKQYQDLVREQDKTSNKEKAVAEYLERNRTFSRIKEILPMLKDKYNRYKKLELDINPEENNISTDTISLLATQIKNEEKELLLLDKNISTTKKNKPGEREEYENIKEILLKLIPVSKNYHETNKQNINYAKDKLFYISEYNKKISEIEVSHNKYVEMKEKHKRISLSNLAVSIEEHLHDGDICPVCSGVYHNNKNITEDISTLFQESEKMVDTLFHEKQNLEKEKNNLDNKIISISETISNNEIRIGELTHEWNEIKGIYLRDLHPENKNEANSFYLNNEKKLNSFRKWEEKYHSLINEERQKKDNYSKLKNDFNSLTEKLNKFTEFNEIAQFIEENIKPYNISISQNDFISILESYYNAYEMKLTDRDVIKNDIIKNENKLNQLKIILEQLQLRTIELEKVSESLKNKSETEKNTLKALLENETIDSLNDGIKNLRISREKKLGDDSKILADFREQLSQITGKLENLQSEKPGLTEQLENTQTQLQEILETNHFRLDDFKISGLRERAEKLSDEINILHDRRIRAEEVYKNTMSEVEKHNDSCRNNKTLSEISDALKIFNIEMDELSRTIGIIDEKLEEDDKKRSQVKDLSAFIEKQEINCLKWSRMKNLIGSADGKNYRRFVQGLTLEKLVNLANKHLIRLNNRYKIERSDEKELEIEIIDCWQADTVRPSATLSGGESFLVSLALSLGLSELVGNKVVIDSLFLDEGFGTLDPDTLETVLSALETLQSTGKLIGIISHIEAIRERISVQIKVRKLAGGRSIIDIV